jgi:hypothetical protein
MLYEAKIVSEGSCGNIKAVFGLMLEALFKDFPNSASDRRSVPMPENVKC